MKYQMQIEYEAPQVGTHGFSTAVALKHVEKALGEYLNSIEAVRINSISKLYGITTTNTIIPAP